MCSRRMLGQKLVSGGGEEGSREENEKGWVYRESVSLVLGDLSLPLSLHSSFFSLCLFRCQSFSLSLPFFSFFSLCACVRAHVCVRVHTLLNIRTHRHARCILYHGTTFSAFFPPFLNDSNFIHVIKQFLKGHFVFLFHFSSSF